MGSHNVRICSALSINLIYLQAALRILYVLTWWLLRLRWEDLCESKTEAERKVPEVELLLPVCFPAGRIPWPRPISVSENQILSLPTLNHDLQNPTKTQGLTGSPGDPFFLLGTRASPGTRRKVLEHDTRTRHKKKPQQRLTLLQRLKKTLLQGHHTTDCKAQMCRNDTDSCHLLPCCLLISRCHDSSLLWYLLGALN